MVNAIVTKKIKGQPIQKWRFSGSQTEVERQVYDKVSFLPFWDTTIKWKL